MCVRVWEGNRKWIGHSCPIGKEEELREWEPNWKKRENEDWPMRRRRKERKEEEEEENGGNGSLTRLRPVGVFHQFRWIFVQISGNLQPSITPKHHHSVLASKCSLNHGNFFKNSMKNNPWVRDFHVQILSFLKRFLSISNSHGISLGPGTKPKH